MPAAAGVAPGGRRLTAAVSAPPARVGARQRTWEDHVQDEHEHGSSGAHAVGAPEQDGSPANEGGHGPGHGAAVVGVVGVAAAAGAVAAGALRRHGESGEDGGDEPGRWRAVTVQVPREQLERGLPAPLAALGHALEVRLVDAPGDRGTEVHVRLRDGEPSGVSGAAARLTGNDPRQDVRRALRESKSLLETGEVLQPDSTASTETTPANLQLQWVTEHGRDEGRL